MWSPKKVPDGHTGAGARKGHTEKMTGPHRERPYGDRGRNWDNVPTAEARTPRFAIIRKDASLGGLRKASTGLVTSCVRL